MRILYLHQYFNTPRMAGGTRSYEMARRFAAQGHDVQMITSARSPNVSGRGSGWFETDEDGIHVHWYPVPYSNAMGFTQRIRAFLAFAVHAARRAADLGGDVIFATSTPLTIALPGLYARRRVGRPMVLEVRDLWPEMPIAVGALRGWPMVAAARTLERTAYSRSARVVALSPGMRDGVIRSGYPAERVHVIPNSADLDLFDVPEQSGEAFRAGLPWLGSRPLVVYTGTLGRLNGVTYLARIAAAVARTAPEVRFLVVGDGLEEPEVRRVAAELGVLDRSFFMIGRTSKEQMPAVLSAADVATSLFIDLPEMWYNSANKFFDALAAGRPLMINYRGWQADLLESTGAGIAVPAADPEAAAPLLLGFLGDRSRLERARAEARTLARERFSRDSLARDLEGVLLQAAGEPDPCPFRLNGHRS